jgi:tRNA threonylcarbamoyladenosine biosynthesis protein TsaE
MSLCDLGVKDRPKKVKTAENKSIVSEYICNSPEDTFRLGESLGETLKGGEMVLLYGGLGAGKTLFTKGILNALAFEVDEVTSPSFTLVNLYETTQFDVFHIDLWRLNVSAKTSDAVGLDEILEKENSVTVIEWADHLGDYRLPGSHIKVFIEGDGGESRKIAIHHNEGAKAVR